MTDLVGIDRVIQALQDKMVGKRVRVYSGDGKRKLGEGTYVGNVLVYFMQMPDGSLRSLRDAEKPPSKATVPIGGTVVKAGRNPKIKLDSGRVVYGCQVWWEPVERKPEATLDVAPSNVRRLAKQPKPKPKPKARRKES